MKSTPKDNIMGKIKNGSVRVFTTNNFTQIVSYPTFVMHAKKVQIVQPFIIYADFSGLSPV